MEMQHEVGEGGAVWGVFFRDGANDFSVFFERSAVKIRSVMGNHMSGSEEGSFSIEQNTDFQPSPSTMKQRVKSRHSSHRIPILILEALASIMT